MTLIKGREVLPFAVTYFALSGSICLNHINELVVIDCSLLWGGSTSSPGTTKSGFSRASPETVYTYMYTRFRQVCLHIVRAHFSHTNNSVLHIQFCTLFFPLNHIAWRRSIEGCPIIFFEGSFLLTA